MAKFTRITPPKYRIGRNVLNEYELRALMVEVAKGKKAPGIKIIGPKGEFSEILPNGRLSFNLHGMDINSNFTIDLIRINRESFLKTK